jgi:hypothetical protein
MTSINVLELALRDPSHLTADLAGHPRPSAVEPRAGRLTRTAGRATASRLVRTWRGTPR